MEFSWPDSNLVCATLTFVGGYSIFCIAILNFPYCSTLTLQYGTGIDELPSPGSRAAWATVAYSGFLVIALSQFRFLTSEPDRRDGYLSVVVIVLVTVIGYIVDVGSYYAGSSSCDTYPETNAAYGLLASLEPISDIAAVLLFLVGPLYVLVLIVITIITWLVSD